MFEYLYLKINEISSITTYETITINANYIYLTDDKFNCDKKLEDYVTREGIDNARKRMQNTNGCGLYRTEHRYEIDGIRYHECLCGYRNPSISFYLEIEDKFSKGMLPFPGSFLEQPAKIVDIINRITTLKFERQQRDYKKQQKDLQLSSNNKTRL